MRCRGFPAHEASPSVTASVGLGFFLVHDPVLGVRNDLIGNEILEAERVLPPRLTGEIDRLQTVFTFVVKPDGGATDLDDGVIEGNPVEVRLAFEGRRFIVFHIEAIENPLREALSLDAVSLEEQDIRSGTEVEVPRRLTGVDRLPGPEIRVLVVGKGLARHEAG